MSEPTELKPCPFCGNTSPFTYISYDIAVLRCSCGVKLEHCSARVMYLRNEVPPELLPFTYEPTLLVMVKADGTSIPYPDHNLVGIHVMAAFEHAGLTAIWNRRVITGQ